MLTFRLLGGIGITDSQGRELDSLLRQPKHVALLAYLSSPRPGTWHRRDSVLGIFWPETDQVRARASLRSALHTLRRHLPEAVIRSRGDDDLSIDPDMLQTDAAVMIDDFDRGRFANTLERYKGELLPGIFITDAPPFEKWLELERARIAGIARKAASHLSRKLEDGGDLPGAIDAARRSYELEPDDEAAARRWIALLDLAGDRSQAFAVYERFRNHMSESFGVRPSAETVALLDAIRTRREASAQYNPNATKKPATSSEAQPQPRTRRRWLVAALAVTIAAAVFLLNLSDRVATGVGESKSLVVLPMENKTGDASLDYVASGIADGVARRLAALGTMQIRSGARSELSERVRRDVRLIARQMGSAILLQSSLKKNGDSLEVTAEIVDTVGPGAHEVTTLRFPSNNIADAESRITAAVVGAVFRQPIPEIPRTPQQSVDPESYKLMLKGWYTLLANAMTSASPGPLREYVARDLFDQAVKIDPLNARAWSGLSSAWAALTLSGEIPFADGVERTSSSALRAIAVDSLQGSAWANLAVTRSLKYNDLSIGMKLLDRAVRAEPSNPEIYLIKSNTLRSAHRYDEARDAIRVARSLDPLSTVYLNHEAAVEFCADRPGAALKILESERRSNPDNAIAVRGTIRALALLGRYDEAIALWRKQAESAGNTALAAALAPAHGASGYWYLKHHEGAATLARLGIETTPQQLTLAQFAAGDSAAAYRTIQATPAGELPMLYRLGCYSGADEYRHSPRFKAVTDRIGYLKPH